MRPNSHTQFAIINNNNGMFSRFFFIFALFGDYSFPEYFEPSAFPFCMESTVYVFLPDGVFLLCDHGLDFGISLLLT